MIRLHTISMENNSVYILSQQNSQVMSSNSGENVTEILHQHVFRIEVNEYITCILKLQSH